MEDTRFESKLVHVLRHSFTPSPKLNEFINETLPGSERPRFSFTVKSLSMLALDAVDVSNHHYSNRMNAAREWLAVERSRLFSIRKEIEVKQLGETTLAILMGTDDRVDLFKLMRNTARLLPDAVYLRDQADPKYSMYVRVESVQPFSDTAPDQILKLFNEEYYNKNAQLLSVTPGTLLGVDQYRRVPIKLPDEEMLYPLRSDP